MGKKNAVTCCATESFSLIILYGLYAATSRVAQFSGLVVPNSIMDSYPTFASQYLSKSQCYLHITGALLFTRYRSFSWIKSNYLPDVNTVTLLDSCHIIHQDNILEFLIIIYIINVNNRYSLNVHIYEKVQTQLNSIGASLNECLR